MADNKSDNNEDILDKEIKLQKQIEKIIEKERKELETVYEWNAPERVFSAKNKGWFSSIGIIALVFIALSAATNNFVLIFAIIALVLVLYTLYTIPPNNIKHQITNKGLYSTNHLYLWKNILTFWITERGGDKLMHLEYKGRNSDTYYRRMVILIGKGNLKTIVAYLVQYVDYLGPSEIDQGFLTRWAEGRYIPIIDIVGDTDIATKDPEDSPTLIRIKGSKI